MTVSFQNLNPIRGLQAQPDAKGMVNARGILALDSSAYTGHGPFLNGSPIIVVGGLIRLHVAGTAGSAVAFTGSILKLYDANHHLVTNIPDQTAGYGEISGDQGQIYVVTISGTQFAADLSDIGKFYATTAQTAAVMPSSASNTNGLGGWSYTNVQLDGTTEHATAGDMKVIGITGAPNNVGGVTGTEVLAVIGSWTSGT